jgi:hypothetical protein
MAGKLDELGQWVREFAGYTGIMESKIRKVVDEMVASGKTTLDPQEVYSRLGGGELFDAPKPYVPPAEVPPAPAPEMSLAQKVGSDPNAREAIADRMEDLQGVNPQLAEQAASGNPEAVYEAYKLLATMPPGRPKMNTPTRQMELPLGPGAPEPDIRSLLPERAPEQPRVEVKPPPTIAEQFDSAVTGGSPRVSRWSTPQDQYTDMVHADLMRQPFIRRPMGPDVAAMDDAIDGPAPGMARPAPARPAGKDAPGIPWSAIGAGIAGGLAGSELSKPSGGKPAKKESTTADLVEESRPAPKVAVEEPKPSVVQGPPDYSAQARTLIARANDIQRSEGRQTPESMALIKEADRLYAMAAEGRRTGTQPAIMPLDEQNAETSSIQRNAREQIAQNQDGGYRTQARRMMAELNMRSSQGTISQAEYSRMKSEIDRLFAMADRQDNRPPARPGMGRTQFPRAKENPMQMIPNTRGLRPLAGPKTT